MIFIYFFKRFLGNLNDIEKNLYLYYSVSFKVALVRFKIIVRVGI